MSYMNSQRVTKGFAITLSGDEMSDVIKIQFLVVETFDGKL